MALDGLTVKALTLELGNVLTGGHISKIAQPEADELLITIKNNRQNYRLLLSANPSLPLAYLTENTKPSPLTAPGFCMLLRKHIGSARILSVAQPSMERIIIFHLEHLDELGDVCRKKLIIELMGKYSNIIFCDGENRILDSIRHVSANVSSVREVLPGRPWFIPDAKKKLDPQTVSEADFLGRLASSPTGLRQALLDSFTGISPVFAEELCLRAGVDSDRPVGACAQEELTALYLQMCRIFTEITENSPAPVIYYKEHEPKDFAPLPFALYHSLEAVPYKSISEMLESFFAQKEAAGRIRQRSADLRRVVQTGLERSRRKLILQEKQMRDTQKKEKYRIYGEMLHTYGYDCPPAANSFEVLNYYTGQQMVIPLDPNLSAAENARKYYDRYSKLKRTAAALKTLLTETREEVEHLESIGTALDIAVSEEDLIQIRQELAAYGYVKKHARSLKKVKITSKPFHYVSSDGYDIYVGKNNYQNEELTFKAAAGGDWWFHAKGQPGSHVIVKAGSDELPDRTFEEAARLAAWYSKGRSAPKVEIDYIQKKHVKKVAGAKPGFVIYHTNYSMTIEPDISMIRLISD